MGNCAISATISSLVLAGGGEGGGVTEVITVCSLRTSRLAAAAINNNDNCWCRGLCLPVHCALVLQEREGERGGASYSKSYL